VTILKIIIELLRHILPVHQIATNSDDSWYRRNRSRFRWSCLRSSICRTGSRCL